MGFDFINKLRKKIVKRMNCFCCNKKIRWWHNKAIFSVAIEDEKILHLKCFRKIQNMAKKDNHLEWVILFTNLIHIKNRMNDLEKKFQIEKEINELFKFHK